MLTNQGSDMDIQLRRRYSQSLKPCGLQKLIPNHRFSFCWIELLLLTRLTIRSFRPSSHHWTSLDITGIPLRWFESYLTGRSFKVAWGGEVYKAHQLVTGVPQRSVLGPLLFSTYTTSHHWVPSYKHMVSLTIAMLMTHSSISHFDQMIQRYLHGSQAAWQTSRHGWKNITYSST